MQQTLKTYFGYDSFRHFAEEIIRHILGGNDALVLMPAVGNPFATSFPPCCVKVLR